MGTVINEKDREIIAAIRSMGLFRTAFTDDEVSSVVAKAIRSLESLDDMVMDIQGIEGIFPSDKELIMDVINEHLQG